MQQKDVNNERVQVGRSLAHVPPVAPMSRPESDEKLEAGATVEEDAFEEEGLRGWLNVLGAFLILMCTFGYVSAYGVYQSYYQSNQLSTMSPSAIAWIGSSGISLEYATGALGGQLFDKGWYYTPMRFGCVIVFMIPLCKSYWQFFLCQGLGIGFAVGLACLPSLCVIPQYFRRRQGAAMGIAMSGTSLGAAVFPLLLNSTFEKKGFKEGVRIAGYFIIGCLIVANCLMKTKYKKRIEGVKQHKRVSVKQLATEMRYVMAVLSGFLLTMGMFFPIYYIQTLFEDLGIRSNITLYSLSILNAGSFFGRIVPNILCDHFGPLNVLAINALAGGCITLAMFGVKNAPGAIVYTVIFGYVSGGFVSVLSPVFLQLSRDPSEDGIRQGGGFLICGAGALIGPPATGALLTAAGGDFKYAIIFSACIMFSGAALTISTRFILAKEKGTWKV